MNSGPSGGELGPQRGEGNKKQQPNARFADTRTLPPLPNSGSGTPTFTGGASPGSAHGPMLLICRALDYHLEFLVSVQLLRQLRALALKTSHRHDAVRLAYLVLLVLLVPFREGPIVDLRDQEGGACDFVWVLDSMGSLFLCLLDSDRDLHRVLCNNVKARAGPQLIQHLHSTLLLID